MTYWHARVVLSAAPAAPEAADRLLDAGRVDAVAPLDGGRWALSFGVDATPATAGSSAVSAALAAARAAGLTRVAPQSVEFLTEAEMDRRLAERPPLPPLVTVTDIADVLGVGHQRASQIVKEHPAAFPVATTTRQKVRLYYQADLDAFAARDRKPGRPRKEPVAS